MKQVVGSADGDNEIKTTYGRSQGSSLCRTKPVGLPRLSVVGLGKR